MKEKIIELLLNTKRTGMDKLISQMEWNGFFEMPCSAGSHLAKQGGLMEHSLNVYNIAIALRNTLNSDISDESIAICAILHDLGKAGQYEKLGYVENILKSGKQSASKPYEINKELLVIDHEVRSIAVASRFIDLMEEEQQAILWHNGLYGVFKYQIQGKETPLYMLLHFADMWASRVTEDEGENE